MGPPPVRSGGPELLIGAYSPTSIRRVGRWADGFITGGVADPNAARQMYDVAEESWRAEGRDGRPRLVAAIYYALGPNAADRLAAYIRDYYAYFGPAVEDMARSFPSSPEAIKNLIEAFGDVGVDELVCWPTVAELDQIDRLGELVR